LKNIYLAQPNYKGGSGKHSSYWLPYSVGCIWAYAILDERIKKQCQLKELLFLRETPAHVLARMEDPFVVGFSNYIWNINYNLSLAEKIKQRWPSVMIIFGGPEVPDNPEAFLTTNRFIDIAVHNEAEKTFQNILRDHLEGTFKPINTPGISFIDRQGKVVKNADHGRIIDLDSLPSPYSTGVFDEIIRSHDVQWAATFETNRGCPYKCHFCDWGSLTFSKVKKFPIERIRQDLEWFGDHEIEYIFMADANFGIFKQRDFEIAKHMADIRVRKGFPKNVNIQWAKNSNEHIVKIAGQFGSLNKGMTLSVQSMSATVLEAIERRNMAIQNIAEILDDCNNNEIPTYTELILGLPCETLESWKDGWDKLLTLGQHCSIDVWIAQVLVNSALNDAGERHKYGINTISAGDYFFGISESADPAETEIPEKIALIRETNSLPFDELIEAYMYGWMMINFHLFGWTQLCARFLYTYSEIPYRTFYDTLFNFVKDIKGNNLISSQYRLTKERITAYLTEGAIEINLRNEIGFDIKFVGHNLMHSSQMVLRHRNQETLADLEPFLMEITDTVEKELRSDLLHAQKSWLILPEKQYPCQIQVNSNLYDYVLRGSTLSYGAKNYELDYVSEVKEVVDDFGQGNVGQFLEMFWMKRRWGPGTAHTKLL
jgi:hypothetical protein